MPDGQVLEFAGVTKQFGTVRAVSAFSARIEPGAVTGFLGPNGAGKTTTLRILLGLVRATSGTATIGGQPYARLARPLQTVGAVLEASSFHPGRTAANHLTIYAQAAGLPVSRVDEVLGMVGLAEVGGSKVGGFSLGMKQRLSLAYALLGDPGVLILDEPANGLDPEGIIWMRSLLRELARQGRTVLVSSHLLAEVQQTVDALLIIAQGRLVFQGGLDELTEADEFVTVVDSPDRSALAAALTDSGAQYDLLRSGFTVRGATPAEVGAAAAAAGVGLSLLQQRGPGLEEVFLDLVNGTRRHPSGDGGLDAAAAPPTPPAIPDPDVGVDTAAPPPTQPAIPDQPAGLDTAAPPPAQPADPDQPSGRVVADGEISKPADRDAGADTAAPPPAQPADPDPPGAASDAPPRPAFSVASTGVIDIVGADREAASDEPPEYFENPDTVTDLAPGAAADNAEPSDTVAAPASETSDADEPDTDIEVERRPRTERWGAQFDPLVDSDTDDEVSDSDRAADEFFAASPTPSPSLPADERRDRDEEQR